jgi:acyl dehydratase
VAPLTRHIVHQRRMIASLSGVTLNALLQRVRKSASGLEALPGPELCDELPAPPSELIRDYLQHVGAKPRANPEEIPPHLFPHWSMPLAARTLRRLPYPLLRVVNGGCRLEINAALRAGEPLHVRARLESVNDDGRRAVIHQRIVTGQSGCADALVAHVYAIVPSGAGRREKGLRPAKEAPRVPASAREIDRLSLSRRAGLEFALLTGDFNPVHWIPAYARALGHQGTILHGFGSMARAFESLERALFAPTRDKIRVLDVRFVRPLVLPATVGVHVEGDALFLGSRGEPALLTGSFAPAPSEVAAGASTPVSTPEEARCSTEVRP